MNMSKIHNSMECTLQKLLGFFFNGNLKLRSSTLDVLFGIGVHTYIENINKQL